MITAKEWRNKMAAMPYSNWYSWEWEEFFAEIQNDVSKKAWLGNATTGELLDEIKARVNCSYRTVDPQPVPPTPNSGSDPSKERPANQFQNECDELRALQAKAVMPIIGGLLDAWDSVPNDQIEGPAMDNLARHLERIDAAMEFLEDKHRESLNIDKFGNRLKDEN